MTMSGTKLVDEEKLRVAETELNLRSGSLSPLSLDAVEAIIKTLSEEKLILIALFISQELALRHKLIKPEKVII